MFDVSKCMTDQHIDVLEAGAVYVVLTEEKWTFMTMSVCQGSPSLPLAVSLEYRSLCLFAALPTCQSISCSAKGPETVVPPAGYNKNMMDKYKIKSSSLKNNLAFSLTAGPPLFLK